ncbi:MAG: stage III sporulation protein AC [Christensenellales bacterium]
MNIDLLFQIAGVGILIFAVNQVLQKAGREDIAVLASVAGLVVVMFLVVDLVAQLLKQCEEHLRFVLRRQG